MKKNTTVIVMCGLLLLADIVTFQHTMARREALGFNILSLILFAEILAAMILIWLAATIKLKDRYKRKLTLKGKERLAIVRP